MYSQLRKRLMTTTCISLLIGSCDIVLGGAESAYHYLILLSTEWILQSNMNETNMPTFLCCVGCADYVSQNDYI